jgi:hypothetical protein
MELRYVHRTELGTVRKTDRAVSGSKVNGRNSPQPHNQTCVESM